MLLNKDIDAVPINWYVGDYAYNAERLQRRLHRRPCSGSSRGSRSRIARLIDQHVASAAGPAAPAAACVVRLRSLACVSYIIRRLLLLIPTVFFAISFLFLLFFVLPGDPATLLAGGADRTVDPGSSSGPTSATASTTRSSCSSRTTGGAFCAGTSASRS